MYYFHNIDPVAFSILNYEIKWYGIMYAVSLLLSVYYLKFAIKEKKLYTKWKLYNEQLESLCSYIIIGMLLGARIFYIVFYNLDYYIENPFEVFSIHKGGLSFHGGIIFGSIAIVIFAVQHRVSIFLLLDLIALVLPFGIFLGRIGNFINGELFGKIATHKFAIIFSSDQLLKPRHPSQLYEAIAEGLIIFIIINFIFWKTDAIKNSPKFLSAIFLILYSLARLVCEIFREPEITFAVNDLFGSGITLHISMGQLLTFATLLIFGIIFLYSKKTYER